MSESSSPFGATSTNADGLPANPRQVLATRLAKLKLEAIAEAIGKDDTEACKVRSGERRCTLSEFCALLDVSNLKLVDKGRFCVKRDEFEFMRKMTARALANQAVAQQLTFDDPE